MCLFFFFFQAEDGIRDRTVTGVQTCALPIFSVRRHHCRPGSGAARDGGNLMCMPDRNNSVAIGIVNNMPDSALEATERQFLSLIEAAAGDMTVRVKFYALPDVPRSDAGRLHAASYSSIRDLWNDEIGRAHV